MRTIGKLAVMLGLAALLVGPALQDANAGALNAKPPWPPRRVSATRRNFAAELNKEVEAIEG